MFGIRGAESEVICEYAIANTYMNTCIPVFLTALNIGKNSL